MKDLFSDKVKHLLCHPEKWKCVSIFAEDVKPLSSLHPWQYVKENHRNSEILLILEGSSRGYFFNGRCYPADPGTFFMIDSNVEHELQNIDDFQSGQVFCWIYFLSTSIVLRVFRKTENRLDQFNMAMYGKINFPSEWEKLNSAANTPCFDDMLARFRMLLATEVYAVLEEYLHESPESSVKDKLINAAKEHIRANFHRGINGDELAKKIGYSRYYFSRVFKGCTGMTVQQFIDQCRVEKFRMLVSVKMSRKELAAELGFMDVHSFYKWYKKVFNR